MIKTAMHVSRTFSEPPSPGEISEMLEDLSGRCYSLLGRPGSVTDLDVSHGNNGWDLEITVEVEEQ